MNDHKKFYLVSLGCAKNSVDSDSMASLLTESGWEATDKPSGANLLIVNTCGFIAPAREESYRVLHELANLKQPDQYLIAAGCLTQRYREEVTQRVPGVDGLLGTRRWMDILEVVEQIRPAQNGNHRPIPLYHLPDTPTVGRDERDVLRISRQGNSAYLKIADGCRRPCAFCAIPLIKGTEVSRPFETILEEARKLQKKGIKELVLIAQDTTDYGYDLGMKDGLAVLLAEMVKAAKDIPWIRVMYAYPGYVTDRLIEVMATHEQILPYLDMPLQHAHPMVLRRMHRPANMDWVRKTLEKMRSAMPGLALRSTFIVGYPDETEEEFQSLLDFVEEIRFDHIGVFPFSFEPGTASEPLGDPVSPELKEERLARLMLLQEKLSLEKNQSFVGQEMDMLVEGQSVPDRHNPGVLSVGRSWRDAPEVDGLVIAEGKAPVGEIVKVLITGALVHDLTGVL